MNMAPVRIFEVISVRFNVGRI